jgi:hypothetical protein
VAKRKPPRSKRARPRKLTEALVEWCRKEYAGGNPLMLLIAIDACLRAGSKAPMWTAQKFCDRIDQWFRGQAKTLDEAFGVQRPPGDSKRCASTSDQARQPETPLSPEQQRFAEHFRQRRLAWLRRPHIARWELEDPPDNVLEDPEDVERARKQNELAKKLGWQPERLARFKQLVLRYEKEPTIANYLQIRRDFPETEIEVGYFGGGIDAPFELEEKFAGQGIDPMLLLGAMLADEPDIDALCLQVLELLVTRGKLPKEGPGFIEKRRKAISDATINYLIVEILEAIDRRGDWIHIPASLVVLIREQLCRSNPDLHQQYLSRERFRNAASIAGRHFRRTGEQISVRDLAAAAGVSRGTAARWLADKRFHLLFESGSRLAASED